MQTVTALLGSLLTPSAIELIDAGAASDMSDFFGLNLPTEGYTLAINFEGSLSRDQPPIGRNAPAGTPVRRIDGRRPGRPGTGRSSGRQCANTCAATVTCKVAMLVSQVASYLETITNVCRRHRLEAAVVGHAGNGILYVELRPGDATPRLAEAIAELRQHAREARGSLVIERCPIELKTAHRCLGRAGGRLLFNAATQTAVRPERYLRAGSFS